MKVILIRHTQVEVASGTIYGFTDVGLALTFAEEARSVAQSLEGEKFDAVFSSPLSRCRKLAAYCGYPRPFLDERLKEMNFGKWEMQNWETLNDPLLQIWFNDWINTPAKEGESLQDQYRRVSAFLDELKSGEYRRVCLFTHSGVIRCAMIYAGLCSIKDSFSFDLPFGSKTEIDI